MNQIDDPDARDRARHLRFRRGAAARVDPPSRSRGPGRPRGAAAGARRGAGPRHVAPDDGTPYLGRLAFGLRRPRNPVPGLDVAGTVVAVGGAVTRFAAGDEVFGVGKGTFAEYAVAREDKLARKPARLGFEQAAVVPVSASTALQALTDHGRLKPGQTVLVIGASGGVGSYAVQLAKALGARRSPGWPAPRSSTWCAHWAPTTSSTTPARTSRTAPAATTWSSTSAGTRRSRGCGARSPPRARP